MNTTANLLSCDDHCMRVRALYGCKGEYRYFNDFHGQHKYSQVCVIDKVNVSIVLVVRVFTNGYQQIKTQIPIAGVPAFAAPHQPAVSSIALCKTPAR